MHITYKTSYIYFCFREQALPLTSLDCAFATSYRRARHARRKQQEKNTHAVQLDDVAQPHS